MVGRADPTRRDHEEPARFERADQVLALEELRELGVIGENEFAAEVTPDDAKRHDPSQHARPS